REVTLIRKAHLGRYFGERNIRCGEQALRSLDPKVEDVLLRCQPYRLLEQSMKVERTQEHGGRNPLQRNRFIEMRFYELDRRPELVRGQATWLRVLTLVRYLNDCAQLLVAFNDRLDPLWIQPTR